MVELHIVEHIGDGLSLDDTVYSVFIALDGDVNGIRVSEEIVEVAQDFLIGSYQEYTQIVWLALLQRVDGQMIGMVGGGDEVVYLSVRIASNVL